MKKYTLTVATVLAISSSLMFSSCIGSFSLTKNVMHWNNQVGSKFLNEVVFFAFWVLPVYEVTALADVLVLNSIEFWSGVNPLSASTKVIDTDNGRYIVKCDGKGYDVTNQTTGQTMRLDFEEANQTWWLEYEGNQYQLMTFIDDTHVIVPSADGERQIVELSQAGVMAYATQTNVPTQIVAAL